MSKVHGNTQFNAANQIASYYPDTGVADAYVTSIRPIALALTEGLLVRFLANEANTGPSTLDLDGLGAVPIKKDVGADLTQNDILAGEVVEVVYDGTNWQWTGAKFNTVQNGLIFGGVVTWVSGYTYNISAAGYYINFQYFTSPDTTVTLSPPDGTFDRFDTFIVDNTGTASVLEGIPTGSPTEPPLDTAIQLRLSAALVEVGSTDPGVVAECIYLENTEWTTTPSHASINPASTSLPYGGIRDVEATSPPSGTNILFSTSTFLINPLYNILDFWLRAKNGWNNNKKIKLQWELSGNPVGNIVTVQGGSYGFVASNTTQYQEISMALSDFALPPASLVDGLRITTQSSGSFQGFYIDNICLLGQTDTPPPNPGGTGTSGTSGTSGLNGATTGTSGTSGTAGSSGTSAATSGTSGSGTSGTSGVNGNTGSSGTSGSSGINGTSGTTGTSGSSGSDGATTGTSGSSGSSGTSAATSGTSGGGTSGSSGTSGTGGGGNVYTADNGLTENPAFNFQLGATTAPGSALLHNSFIDTNSMYLKLTGTGFPLWITSSGSYGEYITATGGSTVGLAIESNNLSLSASSVGSTSAVLSSAYTSTNTVQPVLQIWRSSPAASGNGIGGSIDFYTSDANAPSVYLSNQIISKWTTATHATRTSQFEIWGVSAAVTSRRAALAGIGQWTWDAYGDGTFVDTPVYLIGTKADGTIIEVDPGTIGGGNMRFAYPGEDDTAAENRLFDANTFNFKIQDATVIDICSGVPSSGSEFHFVANSNNNGGIWTASGSGFVQLFMNAGSGAGNAYASFEPVVGTIGNQYKFSDSEVRFRVQYGSQDLLFYIDTLPTATTANVLYYNTTTKQVTYGAASGISGITADNGLTANTSTNVRLGGTLIQNTAIASSGKTLTINHANSLSYVDFEPTFTEISHSFDGTVATEAFVGIYGNSSTANEIDLEVHGGASLTSWIKMTSDQIWQTVRTASTNTVDEAFRLRRNSTGTPAAGMGASLGFYLETTAGSDNSKLSNQLISKWTTATDATRTSQFIITGVNSAATADLLTLDGNGQLTLNKYGVGSFTGTAAKWLAVTSAGVVIEQTPPVASITADNGLRMSTSTNVQLGGTSAPGEALLQNSYINVDTFLLKLTGTRHDGNGVLNINNTYSSPGPYGLYVTGVNGYGIYVDGSTAMGGVKATTPGGATCFLGQGSNANIVHAYNSGSSGAGVYGEGGAYGIEGAHTNGIAIYGVATAGYGGIFEGAHTTAIEPCVSVTRNWSTNPDTHEVSVLRLRKLSVSHVVNAGAGMYVDFWMTSNTTDDRVAGSIACNWVVATDASRTSKMRITGVTDADTHDLLSLDGTQSILSSRDAGTNQTSQRYSVSGTYKTLTESSATAFVRVNVPTGTVTGGEMLITVEANDATDYQARTLRFTWSAVNVGGTITANVQTPEESVAVSAGTLTVTIDTNDAGSGNLDFRANAASSLTQTTLRCIYQVYKNFGSGVITPQ